MRAGVIPGLGCTAERCGRDCRPERKGDAVERAQAPKPGWVQTLPLFLTSCVTMAGDLAALGLSFLICKMRIIIPTS